MSSSTTRMFTGGRARYHGGPYGIDNGWSGAAETSTVAKAPPREEIESLLDQAAAAYEGGRWEEVLSLSRQALAQDKKHPEALHFEATALAESGDLDASLAAFRRALAAVPEDADLVLGAADVLVSRFGEDRAAVEEGLLLCKRGRALASKRGDRELQYELWLLEAVGLNQLG